MTQPLSRLTIILGLVLLIAGCGFQLRGDNTATALPPSWQQMSLITGNPNSEFSREVQARFSANGIVWVSKDEAAYILRLGPEGFSQRNLSLNAEARAAEFELTMKTNFGVRAANGTEEIEDSSAVVIKQMENDPRNVVGKAEEVRILKTEMRTELAQQIMRRIGFYAASTQ